MRESHVPLYLQIEQELLDLIRDGEFSSYDRVPSEIELSERFGVSRMTARKALDRLVSEGILFRQPGKGTFVGAPKIAHRLSTRLSFSAAMDALGLRHETRVLEATTVPAPGNVALELSLTKLTPVVFIKRLRVVETEPAALHSAYLPIRFARILEDDLTKSLLELMQQVGARLVDARDTVEAVVGTGDASELLQVAPGTALLRQTGVGLSSTGEPLRYTEALYRGDRFRFNLGTSSEGDLLPELKRASENDT
jgi:GntR family transcriptional regulator, N-acetylglucosamine utilization regulator